MTRARELAAQTRKELADGTARRRRETAGIRLDDMAAEVGVTVGVLSRWERGEEPPDDDQAAAYGRDLVRREQELITQTRRDLADGVFRHLRLAAGIPLADLAAALGAASDTVLAWERGECVPEDGEALGYGRGLAVIVEVRAALADGSARTRREAARISLGEFAATIGVSPAAVSQWERQDEAGRPVRVPGARHALAYGRELAALERKAA